jgi:hypothetical protein
MVYAQVVSTLPAGTGKLLAGLTLLLTCLFPGFYMVDFTASYKYHARCADASPQGRNFDGGPSRVAAVSTTRRPANTPLRTSFLGRSDPALPSGFGLSCICHANRPTQPNCALVSD